MQGDPVPWKDMCEGAEMGGSSGSSDRKVSVTGAVGEGPRGGAFRAGHAAVCKGGSHLGL